ncbi:MAG: hypothetical protein WCF22_22675 [Candidatus Sulfotelmatobacter sp.]
MATHFLLAINLAAVTDLENEDYLRTVLNVADRTVVSDAITPQRS